MIQINIGALKLLEKIESKKSNNSNTNAHRQKQNQKMFKFLEAEIKASKIRAIRSELSAKDLIID